MTSTCDSAESIATSSNESDLDDELIRNMLDSPLCFRREKEVPTDHEFITPSEKTQCQVHLTFEKVQGNLTQCSHTKECRVKRHFSDREGISSEHQLVPGKGETFFRFSDPKEAARLVLEEQRDHPLADAKSEILKQKCIVDTLNACTREFRRRAHSSRLEMDNVNCGCEESRREQARLHEELSQREKALRDTRIRNNLEVEELKRAQEMRTDEFSRHDLREGHATIQRLTSQTQELQERVNYMNDSGEFEDVAFALKTMAVVTNRSGPRGVERGQGECYQWKAERQFSRGDKCSFRHDEDKRAKPTPKTPLPTTNTKR